MTTPNATAPLFFAVPATARRGQCRCGREIFWILTKRGKPMPVDCTVDGGIRPQIVDGDDGRHFHAGRGVSHFATCPEASTFRRPRV